MLILGEIKSTEKTGFLKFKTIQINQFLSKLMSYDKTVKLSKTVLAKIDLLLKDVDHEKLAKSSSAGAQLYKWVFNTRKIMSLLELNSEDNSVDCENKLNQFQKELS